jgi:sigma-54 dependent transcriptional regulator, flagellar regulatory protein
MSLSTIAERKNRIEDMLIGGSAPMTILRDMVRRVARSSASVMICGASGSGKEVVARAIHMESARAAKPYIALNCGAIPAELIESELFGHEKGAFTGAQNRRTGHFENADKGTLFLDEIGDMRFDMQVTHQNIDNAITEGRFREDLFFRLGVVLLQVPSLAERVEDIPQLIAHFQKGKSIAASCHFDASAIQRLMLHNWPGNVRELRNVVERASVLFSGETVDAFGVDQLLGRAVARPTPIRIEPKTVISDQSDAPIDLKAQIERIELERIQIALERAEGVISEAARMLTLKRTTLIEKMRKYGVERLAA